MKRNHNVGAAIIIVGMCNICFGAYGAPTVSTCKTVFTSPSQCTTYSLSTAGAPNAPDGKLYICTCEVCSDGYHLGSGSTNVIAGGYYMMRANTCAANTSSGSSGSGSGTSRPSSCSTGSLCTMCKGPSVTINGQLYCGMWASTNNTGNCTTPPGANVAYTMSPCCNTDGKAVGYTTGCYVSSCKTGMVVSDDKKQCVCDIGYYGTASSGCTQCPALGGMNGLTREKGKKLITDCFIPAGYIMQDSTGKYKFTSDCDYK